MYVGVPNDLVRRLHEHKNKLVSGFTKKYNVSKLVYFEETKDVHSALARERKLRNGAGRRRMLVVGVNPEWKELSEVGKDFSLGSK